MIGYATTPIKHVATIVGRIGWHGLSTSDYDTVGDYLVTGTEFTGRGIAWSECHRVSTEIWKRDPRIQLSEGDLLITKDGTIGKVALVDHLPGPATLNSGIFRISPRRDLLEPRFAFWVLSSRLLTDFIEVISSGSTISHLYQADFVDFRLPLPSISAQRAVANFLDAEIKGLDQLIIKHRALVNQLEARVGSALWFALVGSRPEASTWTPLKRVASYIEGPGILASDFREAGVPLLRIASLVQGSVTLDGCGYLDPDQVRARWHHLRVRAGELLVSGSASSGMVAVVPPEAEGAVPYTGLIRIFPRAGLVTRDYLEAFLASDVFLDQVESLKAGVAIQHWGPSHLDRVRLPLPSIGRQGAIAAAWKRHRKRTKELIDTIERQMRLLQERRRALITAAVTGQIPTLGAA